LSQNIDDLNIKDVIKAEWIRCANDPIYFFKKYCWIQNNKQGKIKFNLWPFQEKVLDEMIKHPYNIILKSRQLGISQLSAMMALHFMIFNSDKFVLVIATKQDVAKNIVKRVTYTYDNLPSWIKAQVESIEKNKLSLTLTNGSGIKAISSSGDSGRSESISMLIVDEAAFIDNMEEIWGSIQQTLPGDNNGRCIVLSCVVGDTYVYTNRGIKKIKDFDPKNIPGDYQIDNYSVLGKNVLREGNLFKNSGLTDTIKIITKHGELEGSKIHKLWAYKANIEKYGWYKLEELEIGDYVSMQIGSEVWGNNDEINVNYSKSNKIKHNFIFDKITPELAYLFGLYISEGSTYKVYNKQTNQLVGGNITITCGDPEITWVFDKLNINYSCWDGLHYTLSSKLLIELFEHVGFDLSKKAHDKVIPDRLLEMSRENIISMLRGIFDGDGSSAGGKVSVTSSSLELIKQIRALLINFGILSSYLIHDKDKMNSYNSVKNKFNYDTHVLELYGKNAVLYFEKIGFSIKRKQENYNLILDSNFSRGTSHNIIPNSISLLKTIKMKTDVSASDIFTITGRRMCLYANQTSDYKTKNISKDVVLSFYSGFKHCLSEEDIKYWDKIVDPSLVWVSIKKIEYDKKITYDFSLPDSDDFWCHSVIYNGFLGHQTPNGVGNWYYKEWVKAKEGVGEFYPIRLHWSMRPDRDQAWRNQQDVLLGERLASQECDANFLTSGNTLINSKTIQYYLDEMIKPPTEKRKPFLNKGIEDESFWIWKYPQDGKSYIMGADVARGDGSDFSACHVFESDTMIQCAEFKGQIDTVEFGKFLVMVANMYNQALLVVENNNSGWSTIQTIVNLYYLNLYYTADKDIVINPDVIKTNKLNAKRNKSVPGFSTTSATRPAMMDKLEKYFSDNSVIIYSERTMYEIQSFIWKNGRPEAAPGFNDDLVMSLAIALWVRDTSMELMRAGQFRTQALIDSAMVVKGELDTSQMPIGYMTDANPYQMKISNDFDEYEDLSEWL